MADGRKKAGGHTTPATEEVRSETGSGSRVVTSITKLNGAVCNECYAAETVVCKGWQAVAVWTARFKR